MTKKYLAALYSILFLIMIINTGCSSSEETVKGLPYDPEGSTITTDKEITPHHKRTFLFSGKGIYVSNEFPGARLNDFYLENDSLFVAHLLPENAPINNSAWYAFKVWSESPQKIQIMLTYDEGSHRYYPKLSRNGRNWQPIDSAEYIHDTSKGTALLSLDVDSEPLWVSAQELLTSDTYSDWMNKLAEKSYVDLKTIGYSERGRPIEQLIIGSGTEFAYFIGRLHPPEIPGAIAMEEFVKTFAEVSELAEKFRKKFMIYAVPLVNPDGADNGHWRHNIDGVDLNRDWIFFNQKEPSIIRDDMISKFESSPGSLRFFIDFHSTQEDVFYINSEDTTNGPDENYKKIKLWFEGIAEENPDYHLNIDESLNDPKSPTSDSWVFKRFGAPALTYEVGDETDRELIKKVARSAARSLMKLMLDGKI